MKNLEEKTLREKTRAGLLERESIIWLYVVCVIWKERNNRIFQRKEDKLQALSER